MADAIKEKRKKADDKKISLRSQSNNQDNVGGDLINNLLDFDIAFEPPKTSDSAPGEQN